MTGKLRHDVPMASRVWFGAAGRVQTLFIPETVDELAAFLARTPPETPVQVMGVGSNLIIRDGGLEGVTVRLGKGFSGIEACADHQLLVGAAALDRQVAQVAAQHGLGGLAFLSGIPGTIGGGLVMNAGAYGCDMAQRLVWAEALDRQGRLHRLSPERMGYGYRSSDTQGLIMVRACLQGEACPAEAIEAAMHKIKTTREASQPVRARTGGSTFKNPEGTHAWKLIEAARCQDLHEGAVSVSPQHHNFLINHGGASADDIETLGERIRAQVQAHTGVLLDWEIKRMGVRRKPLVPG